MDLIDSFRHGKLLLKQFNLLYGHQCTLLILPSVKL